MKKLAIPDKNICVACGVCLKTCPREAISIYRGCFARISSEKCVGCGLCAKACPAGCITIAERSAAR